MLFGAHVSSAGGPPKALERAEEMGAEAMQIHTQSPRMWRPSTYGPDDAAEYKEGLAAAKGVRLTVCHASYLVNLATDDEELLAKSRQALAGNLRTASSIGATSLVLHVGSHGGRGLAVGLGQVGKELERALDEARPSCRLLLENTAGAGGTIGRNFDELAAIISAAGGDERLGACLDTQHLFASGVGFDRIDDADAVVRWFDDSVGLGRLGCLHVNDSAVPLGGNRDRHANIGEGFIGTRGLGSLLSHPELQGLPAILEVPGVGRKGTDRHELEKARAARRAGLARRRRRAATRPPRPVLPTGLGGRTGSQPGR